MQNKFAAIAMIMICMIGMTGLAAAGSQHNPKVSMGYEMSFTASGDGSLYINTVSGAGSDVQSSQWTNADVSGFQNGQVSGWREMDIQRSTTITGIENGVPAAGTIWTQSVDDSGSTITAFASYYDDDAYGSHVSLSQDTIIRNKGGKDFMCSGVGISGYGYGADNPDPLLPQDNVYGGVTAVTGGDRNVVTHVYAVSDEGGFDLDVDAHVCSRKKTDTAKMTYGLEATNNGGMGWFIDVNGHPCANGGATYTSGATASGMLYGQIFYPGGHHPR